MERDVSADVHVLPVAAEEDELFYRGALEDGLVRVGDEIFQVEGVDPIERCILVSKEPVPNG